MLLLAGRAALAAPDDVVWTDTATFLSAPDGDTLKVRTATHGDVSVRVAGIDSPEHGQAYWRVAKAHLVDLASRPNMSVACYKVDRYQRHICRVRSGSTDLGASLVEAGLAWHYKQYQKEQTAEERELYARLEAQARERRLGLWVQPDPMNPAECRKARKSGEKCH